MSSIRNLQHANTGNLGDIVKHAALVEAMDDVQRRAGDAPINCIDTHTFLAETALANSGWRGDVERVRRELGPKLARLDMYARLQEPWVARSQYLGSARIALEKLAGQAVYALAEEDPITRETLEQQVVQLGLKNVHIAKQYEDWIEAFPLKPGPVVMLVDPFELDDNAWAQLMTNVWFILGRARAKHAPATLVVYAHCKNGQPTLAPPPTGFSRWDVVGPVDDKHCVLRTRI